MTMLHRTRQLPFNTVQDVENWLDWSRFDLHARREIASLYCDLNDAATNNNVPASFRAIVLLHQLISNLCDEPSADRLCSDLIRTIPINDRSKVLLTSNKIFFVWIGDIDRRSIQNILIWKLSNPDFIVQLWIDGKALLAGHFRSWVLNSSMNISCDGSSVFYLQDRFFDFADAPMTADFNFDEVVLSFLAMSGLTDVCDVFVNLLQDAKNMYEQISHIIEIKDISAHAAEIMSDEFNLYYLREICLRANLACASDIIRMHLLFKFGGIYIDCDTLPSLDHVSGSHHCSPSQSSILSDVIRSEMFIERVLPLLPIPACCTEQPEQAAQRKADLELLRQQLLSEDPKTINRIEDDFLRFEISEAFRPLGKIALYHQGLLLASDPHHCGCFNNNVIIANQNSKAIKIILREMRRRFRYLGVAGFEHVTPYKHRDTQVGYLERLAKYRYDGFSNSENVTVTLSGPGLIIEVLLGISSAILRSNVDLKPSSICFALYDSHFGVSFAKQSFYTYDHSKSAWMTTADDTFLI